MIRIFSSLKTTLALVAALVALSGFGSFAIQARPESYATIESGILLEWLQAQGIAQPADSWWIFGMIAVAALLCANTAVCVAVRLGRALRHRTLTAHAASAHLAHVGFLLVLAAHLLGAVAGFRADNRESFPGGKLTVPARPNWTVEVGRVAVAYAPQGYPTSLEADLRVLDRGRLLASGTARVNHPLMVDGAAVYVKNGAQSLRGWAVQMDDGQSAVAEIGKPLHLAAGTLLLSDWRKAGQGLALHATWTPTSGPPRQGWIGASPGGTLPLPNGPVLTWGELSVDTLGTFDVRYDPGASLALAGGTLLSASLVPLLWPRRRLQGALEREATEGS